MSDADEHTIKPPQSFEDKTRQYIRQSEPSLNSPLIDKLVKDVAAIDTSRDMRSEPNTELKVYHTICEDGYRRELVAKDDVETLIAQKVAEARIDTTNIQDWVNRGLESSNTDVWFRSLQMINAELKADRGK